MNVRSLDLQDAKDRLTIAKDRGWSGQVCRSCKKPVIFAKTKRGKTQILDAVPDPLQGNVFIYGQKAQSGPFCYVMTGSSLIVNRDAGVPFHLDHHATCPEADQWRR